MKRPAVLLSLTVVLVLTVLSLGLVAFAYSGAVNVAASEDYLPGAKWFFDTVSSQRLDGLVENMNAASGQAKVDATAAVVTEIAAQRKTMREGMMNMHQGMMGHMMEHMQAGPESMAMCPMMKMGGMKH